MGSKYRKTLSTGLVPPGDKAWCVHCDEWRSEPNPDYDPNKPYDDRTNADSRSLGRIPCDRATCDCKCHTKLRKPKCLCAAVTDRNPWDSPVGCCHDCNCRCHVAEKRESERTRDERKTLWAMELVRREKQRFIDEGVHDWEKQVLQYIMLYPKNINQEYKHFLWAMNKKPEESGIRFMERMLLSNWGRAYIKKNTPIQSFGISF